MSQVAIVTGANRGIGLEVVKQLVELGYRVGLCSRDLEKGHAALKIAHLAADSVEVIELDVSSHEQETFDRAVQQIVSRFGKLDVLVNNAGADYDTYRHAVDANVNEVEETFATNFFGAWRMAVACIPHLKQSSGGRIVNVSSGGGALQGMGGGTPAYSTSKSAMNALTIKLASELQTDGILCNAVCPGWVATDMGGGGRPIPDGARGVVWAATLPNDGPTAGFFRDGQPIAW